MYELRPLIKHTEEISLPKCMYSVRSIHERSSGIEHVDEHLVKIRKIDVSDQVNRLLKSPRRDMALLGARQEKLLQQLENLHSQICAMKGQLKSNASITIIKNANKVNLPHDMVLNARPDNPPYSLLLLSKILKATATFKLTFHLHSSVAKLSNKAIEFQNACESAKVDDRQAAVSIRFIWKESGEDTALILSPTAAVPIQGESNILRFLIASIPSTLSFKDNVVESLAINSMLDNCYILQRESTPPSKKQFISTVIIARLSKADWLVSDKISGADLLLYSILQNGNLPKLKNPAVQKWMQRCTALLK